MQETDMEAEFLSLGMDIIGLGVFNYDFRSLTTESPVIKASGIARAVYHSKSCSAAYHDAWHVTQFGTCTSPLIT